MAINPEVSNLLISTANSRNDAASHRLQMARIRESQIAAHSLEMRQTLLSINADILSNDELHHALRVFLFNRPEKYTFDEQKEKDIYISSHVFEFAYMTHDGIKIFRVSTHPFGDPTRYSTRQQLTEIPSDQWDDLLMKYVFPEERFPNGKALEDKVNDILRTIAITSARPDLQTSV